MSSLEDGSAERNLGESYAEIADCLLEISLKSPVRYCAYIFRDQYTYFPLEFHDEIYEIIYPIMLLDVRSFGIMDPSHGFVLRSDGT